MYTGVTPSKLPDKIPAALESCPHACFALTESLEISYCNAAWDRFALENGGGPEHAGSRVISKPFLQFVPRDLEQHFRNLFRTARALGRFNPRTTSAPLRSSFACTACRFIRYSRAKGSW